MANEREAYEWVRVLLAMVYGLTRRLQERPELAASLRHAVLEAAGRLLDSSNLERSDEHEIALRKSLLALDELAQLLETGRQRGELPEDYTSDLIGLQGSAAEAIDRALAEWRGRQPDA